MAKSHPPLANEQVDFLFAAWHLYRGGLTKPEEIGRVLGRPIHANTLTATIDHIDRLLYGPFELKQKIRCQQCGGRLTQVPCGLCGVSHESYREIETTNYAIEDR